MVDTTRDIALLKQGDELASVRVVREFESMVRATCAAHCRDPRDVEEIVQDTFVAAFRGIDALRDPDRFAGWVKQIAMNCCRDHVRATRSVPESVVLPDDLVTTGPAAAPSERDAVSQVVAKALAGLPSAERDVVEARIRGDAHDEIAARLGIAPQTSMNRLARARKRLGHLRRRLIESALLAAFLDRSRAATPAPTATPWLGSAYMQAKTVMFGATAIATAIVGVGIYLGRPPREDQQLVQNPLPAGRRVQRSGTRRATERAPAPKSRISSHAATTPAHHEAPVELTREEELVQRWLAFRESAAFQALNDRANVLTMQFYELQMPADLQQRWSDYSRDPFSMIGLEKEALFATMSAADIQELRGMADEAADALRAEVATLTAAQDANQQEGDDLYQQMLRSMEMTREEHRLAIRLSPRRTPDQIVEDKRHWADVMRAAGMGHVVADATIP
jgi:RNA polymerase sigma-70 factor, ECF subfamily